MSESGELAAALGPFPSGSWCLQDLSGELGSERPSRLEVVRPLERRVRLSKLGKRQDSPRREVTESWKVVGELLRHDCVVLVSGILVGEEDGSAARATQTRGHVRALPAEPVEPIVERLEQPGHSVEVDRRREEPDVGKR